MNTKRIWRRENGFSRMFFCKEGKLQRAVEMEHSHVSELGIRRSEDGMMACGLEGSRE